MSGRLKIHLKPNERIFINGAILKVDRKVAIEFQNEACFLLENRVMEQDAATTPLRQLYFIAQSMLIEPGSRDISRRVYGHTHRLLLAAFKDRTVLEGLVEAHGLMETGRYFDALQKIRAMFSLEAELLASGESSDVAGMVEKAAAR